MVLGAIRLLCASALLAGMAAARPALEIDYPEKNTVFPPDLAPPTFLFVDQTPGVRSWFLELRFRTGEPIKAGIAGDAYSPGAIDERAIGPTNEPPRLTQRQQLWRTWKPAAALWEEITRRGAEGEVRLVIRGKDGGRTLSQGETSFRISSDPVGAPIFFRDVPLMPSEVEKGVIKPLAKNALPLVAWRLRYPQEEKSRLMVENLPTCANCHSFSRDGKTLGLDMDGPANDKGLYALVNIQREMSIEKKDMIAWSSFKGKLGSKIRVGFMSQVSPEGRFVVTMVNPSDLGIEPPRPMAGGGAPVPKQVKGSFYVQNFKDYRFLQVFYPTRGVLAWYSRESGRLQPLPGADDPRFVHTNAVWSPDGKYLVFARAEAREPYRDGEPVAERANDPNETPVQYDLYRIPFNEGRGGKPEPIAGAGANGRSNSFPKITPDGKWIVFVQANNGLLMRPDGQLYIVAAGGGKARRMNCNTPLMNSWHSFSPNGRWMVFSSKSRSPYTQMYLTHIDENGNDTPPVLIENATAANRAVNIPEFVNIGVDDWLRLETPATEFYRRCEAAIELMQRGQHEAAAAAWQEALRMEPDDVPALSNLGVTLNNLGRFAEAEEQFRKAAALDGENYKAFSNLGIALMKMGRIEEAVAPLRRAVELNGEEVDSLSALGAVLVYAGQLEEARKHLEKAVLLAPRDSNALNNLGGVLARQGRFAEAVRHFENALQVEPESVELHYNLGRAQAAAGQVETGIVSLERAAQLSKRREVAVLDKLSALYADAGRYADALATAREALGLAREFNDTSSLIGLAARIASYEGKVR